MDNFKRDLEQLAEKERENMDVLIIKVRQIMDIISKGTLLYGIIYKKYV